MSTNQTMLTLGAFVIFSMILLSFYKILAESSVTINDAQSGVSYLTLATTYMELAQGLSFDETTVDSFLTPSQINTLKAPANLGPDNPPPAGELTENNFKSFDDLDDLKNYEVIDSSLAGILGKYKTRFDVNYVNPLNVDLVSATRTFVKRLDIKVTRIYPSSKDTLKISLVMGYFHFD